MPSGSFGSMFGDSGATGMAGLQEAILPIAMFGAAGQPASKQTPMGQMLMAMMMMKMMEGGDSTEAMSPKTPGTDLGKIGNTPGMPKGGGPMNPMMAGAGYGRGRKPGSFGGPSGVPSMDFQREKPKFTGTGQPAPGNVSGFRKVDRSYL